MSQLGQVTESKIPINGSIKSLSSLIDSLTEPYTTQFKKLSVMLELAGVINNLREDRDLPPMSIQCIVSKLNESVTKEDLSKGVTSLLKDSRNELCKIFA